MKSVNDLYLELYTSAMEQDEVEQREYLSMVSEHRKISVDYLISIGALFIPNENYIAYHLGQDLVSTNNCFYFNGKCLWTLFVIVPIRDLTGDVIAINGWDAYNKYKEVENGEQGLPMYKLSSKYIFPKEKYFFSDVECLKRNFDKRVVFITDGMFDTLSLCYRDIPAIALLGSSFTVENLFFLKWFKVVYVCADNDAAGNRLYNQLKLALPKVYRVYQDSTKDIEELLRADGIDGPITKKIKESVDNPIGDIILGESFRRFRGAPRFKAD